MFGMLCAAMQVSHAARQLITACLAADPRERPTAVKLMAYPLVTAAMVGALPAMWLQGFAGVGGHAPVPFSSGLYAGSLVAACQL